jgi:hypothetical protein
VLKKSVFEPIAAKSMSRGSPEAKASGYQPILILHPLCRD